MFLGIVCSCWCKVDIRGVSSCLFRFQEIVPLNPSNILGAEDNGPAKKWVSLIRKTLNNRPGIYGSSGNHTPSPVPNPIVEINADF